MIRAQYIYTQIYIYIYYKIYKSKSLNETKTPELKRVHKNEISNVEKI